MDSSIFRYILRYSRTDQIVILMVVASSFVFYYLSLDLPKTIVNQAIQGKAFTEAEQVLFMRLEFGVPDFLGGGQLLLFDGIPLERIPYLMGLSFLFLGLVVINNAFKFYINTLKGRLGERLLRRLRYQLFDRLLRFPLPHFRKVKPAEAATMIKDEVEPLGGFIGEAFITPAFLGGQALTAMIFIMSQHWILGLVAIAVIGLQMVLIPKLRRPVIRLGRQRQITARQLAGRVAECVDGIREIRANDTSNFERSDITARLARIFEIRFEIYQKKFLAKGINNFLAQLTPFVFYSVGGYFAITGKLDIGALVAVIAAYKDLPGPMKELLDWDQQRLDIQVKYEQVVQQFNVDRIIDESMQAAAGRTTPLHGPVTAINLTYADETGVNLVDGVSFNVDLHDKVAVVGPSGGGKFELAMLLAGLLKPTGGSLSIGDVDMAKAPESITGRRIAYVGPDAYLFPTTVRNNIVYGLWHSPRETVSDGPEAMQRRERWLAETRRTGNAEYDRDADWIDYAGAGVESLDELMARIAALLDGVDFSKDIYEFGLRSIIDPNSMPRLVAHILEDRKELRHRLDHPKFKDLVEPFDRQSYNLNATLGENLIFGKPKGQKLTFGNLAENAYVREVLERTRLTEDLVQIGLKTAETTIEMFADLAPGHEFFEQFSFIDSADLPDYKGLLARSRDVGLERIGDGDRVRLIALSLKLIPARHRFGFIDDALQQRVLDARTVFARDIPGELRDEIDFFDAERYSGAATVLENIMFGKVAYGVAQAEARVYALVGEVLDAGGHRSDVVEAGLEFQVGVGGSRLSNGQRQKLGIVRALLKRPDLMVLNEATAGLDGGSQSRILDFLFQEVATRGLIWVLHRPDLSSRFDHVLVMKDAKLVEKGVAKELNREGTLLHQLIAAG